MTVAEFVEKWGTFAQAIALQIDADRHKWVTEMTADLTALLVQREQEFREECATIADGHYCSECRKSGEAIASAIRTWKRET